MRRIRWFCLVLVISLLCGCGVPANTVPSKTAILIDPGHGGFDGGAVAQDGTLEKDINLAVSLQLRDMLSICGVPVSMTRTTDAGTEDVSDTSIRERKVSDLRNRLALYEQSSLVIAIHQNQFSASEYKGTQVFYSTNCAESRRWATAVQSAVITHLQPDNNRQIKPASNGIYLMYHTTAPAILVECGFLSNPEELLYLKKPQYRQKMAWSILMGYWDYIIGS